MTMTLLNVNVQDEARTDRLLVKKRIIEDPQNDCLINQIAPIYSLPDEILADIFEVGHTPLSPIPAPRAGLAFEILVSQVTRRWRNVAICTPHIWSRIEISPTTGRHLVAVYLRRSGVVPLDLFIDFEPRYFGSEAASAIASADFSHQLRLHSGWQAVIPHLSRCRNIVASPGCLENIDEMWSAFHSVTVMLLERFQMIHDFRRTSIDHVFDGGAPALRDVRIGGLQYCVPPLANVTSLVLWNLNIVLDWSHLRDTVGGLLSLTHFVIGIPLDGLFLPDGFESAIRFPSLHTLRIVADYIIPFEFLLSIFAPSLDSLELEGITSEDLRYFCNNDALRVLEKFPCLQSLTFLDPNVDDISQETCTSFCNMFPHITHLAFDFNQTQPMSLEHFVEAMVSNTTNSDTTQSHILPELHTLSFSKLHPSSINLLSDIVSTRHALRLPLTLVHVPKAALRHSGQFSEPLDRLRGLVELMEYQARDWNVKTMIFE